MRKLFVAVFLFVSLVPVFVFGQEAFVAGYLEGRKVFEGTARPGFPAYSDFGVFLPVYSSGIELGLEGQLNFWGPLSVGGKFLSQWPRWAGSQNHYYLGPTLQVRFGDSFVDGLWVVSVRGVPMFDVQRGFGRFELYVILLFEWKRLQIIPSLYYFWTKDFVWDSTSHQVTVPLEVAVQVYEKRVMLLARPEYSKVLSQDKDGTRVGNVDVWTVPVGVKTENQWGSGVTLWAGASGGPQWRSDRSGTGAAVYLSAGVLWR